MALKHRRVQRRGVCEKHTFKIRLDPGRRNALWQDDRVPLHGPGDQGLRWRHIEFFRDVGDARVVEDSVLSR